MFNSKQVISSKIATKTVEVFIRTSFKPPTLKSLKRSSSNCMKAISQSNVRGDVKTKSLSKRSSSIASLHYDDISYDTMITSTESIDKVQVNTPNNDEVKQLDEEFSSIFSTIVEPSPKKTKPLEYQRPENANILFDSIAPHVELNLLKKMTERLIEITSVFIDSHPINDVKETKDQVLFQKEYKKRFKKHLHRHLHQINWVEPVLLNFLFAKGWCTEHLLQHLRLLAGNKTYAPYKNRILLEKHIGILKQARETSMDMNLNWSRNKSLSVESNAYLRIHGNKSAKQLHDEAEDMANLLADRLPSSLHSTLFTFLEKYGGGEEDVMKRNFLPKIRQIAKSHVHLFAVELAEFLYVQKIPYNTEPSTCTDEKIQSAWEEWNTKRENSCRVFLTAQKMLVDHYNSIVFVKEKEQQSLSEETRDLLQSGSLLEGVKKNENPFQEMAITIDMLENFTSAKPMERVEMQPVTLKSHCSYKVIATRQTKAIPSTQNRIIFIDNLPYDITQHEIFETYSRCGSISSIQLYNPNASYSMTSTSATVPKQFTLASNPKSTNVCASIEFSDEIGYKTAMDPHLTIFGIILRKHLLRSIPCHKMKTIYLSNITPGYFELDVQDVVEKLIQMKLKKKHDMLSTTSTDTGISLKLNRNDVASIELDFPSYELANTAFVRFARFHDAREGRYTNDVDMEEILKDYEGISWDVSWVPPTR